MLKIKRTKHKLIPFQQVLDANFTKEEQLLSDIRVKLKITLRKLKQVRETLQLTQQELAKRANVPRATISKIESGYQNVSIMKVIQVADALDKDVEIKLVSQKEKTFRSR